MGLAVEFNVVIVQSKTSFLIKVDDPLPPPPPFLLLFLFEELALDEVDATGIGMVIYCPPGKIKAMC